MPDNKGNEIRDALEELRRDEPTVICGWSLPDGNHPGRVRLAPWAQTVAAKLHAQFVGDLELTVGFLGYPEATLRPLRDPRDGLAVAHPTQLSITLDGPLTLVSGHTGRHRILVTNLATRELRIATNGGVTAVVVDPVSDALVGISVEPRTMPLIYFTAAPGDTVTVPLLVGTASVLPQLGYAVPPGTWAAQAILDLDEGGRVLTPKLPVTILRGPD